MSLTCPSSIRDSRDMGQTQEESVFTAASDKWRYGLSLSHTQTQTNKKKKRAGEGITQKQKDREIHGRTL